MSARPPLVLGSDGQIQQLQAGDTLAGTSGGSLVEGKVVLTFAAGARSQSFSFTDANATAGCKIYMMPDGASDELELDGFVCAAACLVNGTITARITVTPGPVVGKRTFNYVIG